MWKTDKDTLYNFLRNLLLKLEWKHNVSGQVFWCYVFVQITIFFWFTFGKRTVESRFKNQNHFALFDIEGIINSERNLFHFSFLFFLQTSADWADWAGYYEGYIN